MYSGCHHHKMRFVDKLARKWRLILEIALRGTIAVAAPKQQNSQANASAGESSDHSQG